MKRLELLQYNSRHRNLSDVLEGKMIPGNTSTSENFSTTDNTYSTALKEHRIKTYNMLTNDQSAKMNYLLKPTVFIVIGVSFICIGAALTASHFIFEDSLTAKSSNSPPFFTYGPIAFAAGLIVFIIGLVWLTVKRHKWVKGTASPIATAMATMAAQLAASATMTSEHYKKVPY